MQNDNDIEKLKLELEQAREFIKIKDQRITALNEEVQDLRGKLDTLQKERPKLSPENLLVSFRTALATMQEGLKLGGGRIDYIIGDFSVDLKANVTLDEEGNINFQLPRLEDVIPFENLSTFRLSIKPVPTSLGPPADTAEVPGLVGRFRDAAVETIKATKLKVGSIEKRVSGTAPGIVIGQSPERYSRVQIGSPVNLIISKAREVKVPNLIGIDQNDVIEVIRSAQLTLGRFEEQVSDSPGGTIISQSPTADTIVPVETSIDLVIAKPAMISAPNVIDKKIQDAKKIIETAKLEVGEVTKEPSEKPEDAVIGQNPEVGKEVPVGTPIDLIIASSRSLSVPNVIGMKRDEAEETIEHAQLRVGRTSEEGSSEPPGVVIGQEPAAETRVRANTTVDITISISEKDIVVPDLIGLEREEAEEVVSKTQLKIGTITMRKSKKPKGIVIGQTPHQGTKVTVGTSIKLTISRGDAPPVTKR